MFHYTKFLAILFLLSLLLLGGAVRYFMDPGKDDMITIGIAPWSSHPEFGRSIDGFKQGLAENGYVEDINISFISGDAQTKVDKQQQIIREFIDKRVDLIYSLTTPGTLIAKSETATMNNPIPVVFSICAYPVESNLVASLESSGNNLVGTRNYVPFSRQYYTFEKVYAETKTLAVVYHKDDPNSKNQLREIKSVLEKRDIRVISMAATDNDDIKQQLHANKEVMDAIFSTCDILAQTGGDEVIVEFSKSYQKPSFTCGKEGVLRGHLIGNVGDFHAIGKIAGEKAALILKGAKPTWLITEALRENYIIINRKTANALGLIIPKELLSVAKEIISR